MSTKIELHQHFSFHQLTLSRRVVDQLYNKSSSGDEIPERDVAYHLI